ncbi:tetracycline resistance protein [Halolactibacillus miurensis]|uniref:Small GTP-binding protein domain-containing protein n=2 Tax=Halolactibacillus miurensis TaxID=306541 RepID=A0A1I6P8E0_9BACI|nr:TetM/TetW/TetO/TetS family tetracycline resistance ribosomal protection protein [Halolactibacillus miurensis]GEM03059.1 tetracycline resistance protein [Halolactibacillus miurensis]SFS36368.1 small GTP-binding protein domain-containing protein [Halolactibacillus miurensis]
MNHTIGVFAHVDTGKTTFVEQWLYNSGSLKQKGRVDHKNSFLDQHRIEKARGITIFSDYGVIETATDRLYIMDTPGHVDFQMEMERALSVIDVGVLLVSAKEGVVSHTRTVYHLLKDRNIPVIFFINKTDLLGADVKKVTSMIDQLTGTDSYLFETSDLKATDIEALALLAESLMDAYLSDTLKEKDIMTFITERFKESALVPVFKGATLHNEGLDVFDHWLRRLLPREKHVEHHQPVADVFKVRYENGERLVFVKVLAGEFNVRDEVTYKTFTGELMTEKITAIKQMNGPKQTSIQSATTGMLVALVGLSTVQVFDRLNDPDYQGVSKLKPTLTVDIITSADLHDLYQDMLKLTEEDPSLAARLSQDKTRVQLDVHGEVQLEILADIISDRFGYEVTFSQPDILYQETIKQPVYGYGHFEPLKHYAEVHLLLEPAKRGSGIQFKSACDVNQLSVSHQRLIEQHLFEKSHKGTVIGAPLTDVSVTLTNGQAHEKHTSGGDFREATWRALRQALLMTDMVLLEPLYRVEATVTPDLLGKLMQDITKAGGETDAPLIRETDVFLTGRVPVKTFYDYPKKFLSYTKGEGHLGLSFFGYDEVNDLESITAAQAYDPWHDEETTGDSIFCQKGKGYTVKADEAAQAMHLPIIKK